MERNVLLAIVLAIAVLILFQYLQVKLFSPPPPSLNQTFNQTQPISSKADHLEAFSPNLGKKENIPQKQEFLAKNIFIQTPLYQSTLTTVGGRFTEFKLHHYRRERKNPNPVNLVHSNFYPFEVYLASDPGLALSSFAYEGKEKLELKEKDTERIVFKVQRKGLEIAKIFQFKGDSYYLDLTVEITNTKEEPIKDRLLLRGIFSPFVKGSDIVFKGPFYYTDHLVEVKLSDTLTEYVGPLKYLGVMDVYFLIGVIPAEASNYRATFRKLRSEDEFILWTPEFSLKGGEKKTFTFKLYLGPKRSEDLGKEYPKLAKALYFGYFDIIAKPLLWLLKKFHQFIPNYGVAIIFVTILLRILFFPLNQMSFKSMKKMQELQPVIQRLREKYKDDHATLQKEIMNLYRTHKINPLSGCLPILIQIPVFFAFYKVLLMAIELRHAPFILWITDLSAPERLYLGSFIIPWLGGIPLLTILMGISMFIQQKLTPTSMDPVQEKVMLLLPIFFTFLFVNFPSGLVLYWFVNNLLSIGQQILTLKLQKR